MIANGCMTYFTSNFAIFHLKIYSIVNIAEISNSPDFVIRLTGAGRLSNVPSPTRNEENITSAAS